MKTIYPNNNRIFFKLVVLVALLLMLYSLTKQLAAPPEVANIILSGFLWLMFTLLTIALVISLLGIFKVEADGLLNQFTFYRIFSKKILPASAITDYYVTVATTKYGAYYGRMLKTADDKVFTLDPANLKDINQIDEYLKAQNIEYLGEKVLSYPFIYSVKFTL